MSFPTKDPREWIEHLKSIGSIVEGCVKCEEQVTYMLRTNTMLFAPRHKPSSSCESGRLNGWDHCTCDRCF